MTRFEFLKSAGFTGAALFAALTSCVSESDKYIDAKALDANGNIIEPGQAVVTNNPTTPSTPPNTSPITGSNSANSAKFISTANLDKIKPLVSVDLNAISGAKLKKIGGYLVIDNAYVVALAKDGSYIAATVLCTHEPKRQVIYSNEEWFCTAHDARFTLAGKGINKNGSKGLTIYKVATDGSKLVVY
jgi:nitrite reductase/ring-hydroxylating ferredoxin subunit